MSKVKENRVEASAGKSRRISYNFARGGSKTQPLAAKLEKLKKLLYNIYVIRKKK